MNILANRIQIKVLAQKLREIFSKNMKFWESHGIIFYFMDNIYFKGNILSLSSV